VSGDRAEPILDDGRRRYLKAPDTNGDFALRDQFALAALVELSAIVRPLVIELRDCYRDEYWIPQAEEPDPLVRILVDARAAGRVALRPVWAKPPPAMVVPELNLAVVREQLAAQRSAPSGQRFDWRYLHVIAVAVRSLSPREALRFSNLPEPIEPLEKDWFAGPVGHEGWENTPPVRIDISSEYINVELSTSVHWPPWCLAESEEGRLFNAALDKLVAQGWTEPR